MTNNRCAVCRDPHVKIVVEEDLAKKLSAKFISATMTARGFDVSIANILYHKSHIERPLTEPGVQAKKRDIAILVQEAAADRIEAIAPELLFDDQNDNLLKHGLAAQKALDAREKQKASAVSVLLEFARLFGPRPVAALLEDGLTIDGESVEVE
jgi:hypothetical protein